MQFSDKKMPLLHMYIIFLLSIMLESASTEITSGTGSSATTTTAPSTGSTVTNTTNDSTKASISTPTTTVASTTANPNNTSSVQTITSATNNSTFQSTSNSQTNGSTSQTITTVETDVSQSTSGQNNGMISSTEAAKSSQYEGIEAVAGVSIVLVSFILIAVAVVTGRIERQRPKFSKSLKQKMSNGHTNGEFNTGIKVV